MKIGILTFHDANNYGAVLQAYALQEVLILMNKDAEIVNYKQDYIIQKYKPISIRKTGLNALIRSLASTVLNYKKRYQKQKVFDMFREKHLNISEKTYINKNDIVDYNVLISGSDQVWNTKITNDDTVFFLQLENKQKIKKISYAASIGSVNLQENEREKMISLINNIDYVSVRETDAQNMISAHTTKKITRVLDPTLTIDDTFWHSITKTNNNDEYIFVYAVGEVFEITEVVNMMQAKLKHKVVILSDRKIKGIRNAQTIYSPDPINFLNYIRNASFVVTNSFHGTAFSIVFKKKFVTIPHKTSGSRMRDLMNILNLDGRIIEASNEFNVNHYKDIDYNMVQKVLNKERKLSIDFLKDSINREG